MTTNNRKYIIIFLSLITGCIIVSWLIILPTINKIKKNNAELAMEKEKISISLNQGQNIVENKKNLKKVAVELDKLDNLWLRTGDELKFITDLEKIAERNNLTQIIDFDNGQLKKKTEIKIIPINITLKGNLLNIMSYINQLESLDYYINFTQINFERQMDKLKNYNNQLQTTTNSEQKKLTNHEINLNVKLNGLTYWK